jgi:hypothetical protein
MRPRRSRTILWFLFVGGIALALVLWPVIKRNRDLDAVRRLLKNGTVTPTYAPPAAFVQNLERWAMDAMAPFVPDTEQRFRSLAWTRCFTRGPLVQISLEAEGLQGDLTPALARFRDLRFIDFLCPHFTEVDWTRVCVVARALPHLERMQTMGLEITDQAIAPLTAHPSLRKISFYLNSVTAASIPVFASMPQLDSLTIGKPMYPLDGALFRKALPSVWVDVP